MEMKNFFGKLLMPNMIVMDSSEGSVYAINYGNIFEDENWVQKKPLDVPILMKRVAIEITFDGDINNRETFDETKATVFSVIAAHNDFLFDDSDEKTIIRSIINAFDSSIMPLPKELDISQELLNSEWSYRISSGKMIFLLVENGRMYFEWC